VLADRLEIISVFEIFLADEIRHLSHGTLPEARLVQLRADLLGFLAETARLGPSGARVAGAQLEDALEELASRSGPGDVPSLAARTLAEVKALSPGSLFGAAPLRPLLAELNRLAPTETDPELLRAWARIERLAQLRPRLQGVITDTSQLALDSRAVL